jgi:hypothetical protein
MSKASPHLYPYRLKDKKGVRRLKNYGIKYLSLYLHITHHDDELCYFIIFPFVKT